MQDLRFLFTSPGLRANLLSTSGCHYRCSDKIKQSYIYNSGVLQKTVKKHDKCL